MPSSAGAALPKRATLAEAVERHVRPGDAVHVMLGHSRWTASARELARQLWGTDPGLTLVMASLSSLGALYFRGGLVRKVVTAYSGDSFPTYTPNPIFQSGYSSGAVEVEHWSFLSYVQRLEAAARGLPAAVTGSLRGSSMASNPAYSVVDTDFGPVGLVAPLVPDVALVHAAMADEEGNLIVAQPLLEGVWGAWGARRGVIATVDRVVERFEGLGSRVNVPAHLVKAVVEVPFGAHPGGSSPSGLPVEGYGEDIAFWAEAGAAARSDFDDWSRRWVLEAEDQDAYLALLGQPRLDRLRARVDPSSWEIDDKESPVDTGPETSAWETAAVFGAREVGEAIERTGADAVLAGAGVANLVAWVAVGRSRAAGSPVVLTAELGLWDYSPTPADPYVFNHRVFPGATSLSDTATVLGMIVGGPATRTLGCLGAAQVDRDGNLNSTSLGPDRFLVGSGGGNDVASRAVACVVVTRAGPHRLPARVDYVTSPGERVVSVVTERGALRRLDGELRVAAVPPSPGSFDDRVRAMAGSCGWDVPVCRSVEELEPVSPAEVMALRQFDRRRIFLS